MKRHKNEIVRFILAIVLPALFLTGLGIYVLRVEWRQSKTEEQSNLDAYAELGSQLLRSGARIYGFERHGPPDHDDDGGPGAHRRMPRPDGHDDARRPPRRGDVPLHEWLAWQIAVLPGICEEIEARENKGDGSMVFAVDDASGRRLYTSPRFPAATDLTGACPLAPPLPSGRIVVARADGGAAVKANALRYVVLGGCIIALLVAALFAGGLYFLRTLQRERMDALRKTDFLDNVSHELKTPLAGIRLNAELLEQGRISDEKMRLGALEAILIESDRLAQMVDKLLDFSRLEKGTYRYDIETFNLGEFCDAPSERQGVAAISQGRATVAVAGTCSNVSADKNALRQIGINIVTNAVKYTDGSIDIEVERNEIRYMDRGPGLAPGDEEKVFERFYRADDSLTRSTGGSGLGLSIARSLARGMGGDLTYSRRKGGGSVFTLALKEEV